MGGSAQAGCEAMWPGDGGGCGGGFGPAVQPNCDSLTDYYLADRISPQLLVPLLRSFNANSPEFRDSGDTIDPKSDAGATL